MQWRSQGRTFGGKQKGYGQEEGEKGIAAMRVGQKGVELGG